MAHIPERRETPYQEYLRLSVEAQRLLVDASRDYLSEDLGEDVEEADDIDEDEEEDAEEEDEDEEDEDNSSYDSYARATIQGAHARATREYIAMNAARRAQLTQRLAAAGQVVEQRQQQLRDQPWDLFSQRIAEATSQAFSGISRTIADRMGLTEADIGLSPRTSDNDEFAEMPQLERVVIGSRDLYEARRELLEEKEKTQRAVQAERIKHQAEIDELKKKLAQLESKQQQQPQPSQDPEPIYVPKGEGNKKRQRRSERLASTSKPAAAAANATVPPKAESPKSAGSVDICSICQEELGSERGYLEPCGHSRYHFDCAVELLANHGKCALENPGTKITNVRKIYV